MACVSSTRRAVAGITGVALWLCAFAGLGCASTSLARDRSARSRPRAECRASALSIRLIDGIGAGPTVGGYIAFKNRSKRRCVLSGWPSVRGIQETGASSRAIRVRAGPLGPFVSGIPKVALTHGQRAVAVISAAAGPTSPNGSCGKPYRHLAVRAPGSRKTVVLSAWISGLGRDLPACSRIYTSMVVRASSLDLLSKH